MLALHQGNFHDTELQQIQTAGRGGVGNIQSQLFARNLAGEEVSFVEDAQRTKTARLREARLARDAQFPPRA